MKRSERTIEKMNLTLDIGNTAVKWATFEGRGLMESGKWKVESGKWEVEMKVQVIS